MRRTRTAAIGLMALLLGLGAATPAQAAGQASTRTIDYHGYRFDVPADWRVVDLAARPDACIRFDRPAVYLGRPGERPDCPPGLVGRTQGLLVEPITQDAADRVAGDTARAPRGRATAAGAVSRGGQIQVAVEDAGVLVTAAHTSATEAGVRAVLASARLTADSVRTELPAAAEATPQAVGPRPGDFTGKGFDACTAPSQATMDTWLASSPYRAVGVYLSGSTRACAQPNLTASWVGTQTARGWRLIPIEVGRQAPCSGFANRMSYDPATARSQGASAANGSIAAAQGLGIPAGSVLWWNGVADTNTGSYAPATVWADHQRIHQYAGDVTETWGGATVGIDRNYLDVGQGSPPAPTKYWVDTFADAPVFATPTSTVQTGTLYAATNYVFCKVWGREIRDGAGNYNHWWLRTDPDVGPANQYVSAYYLSRWGNDEARDNNGTVIPDC